MWRNGMTAAALKVMNENPRPLVGPFGRYITFSGTGMVFMAVCEYLIKPLERISGEKPLPYVILGLGAASVLATNILYERCPKRLIIPVGLAGWVFTFLLLFLGNWLWF